MDRIDKDFAASAAAVLKSLRNGQGENSPNGNENFLKGLPIALKQNGIVSFVSFLDEKNKNLLSEIRKQQGFQGLSVSMLMAMDDNKRFPLERKLAILLVWLKRLSAAEGDD